MYVLVLCINLFKVFVGNKRAPKKENNLPKIFDTEKTTDFDYPEITAGPGIDKKTVAAICAAVSCYLQSEGKTEGDFIVRKIRKIF
jgi:hypothetical protein